MNAVTTAQIANLCSKGVTFTKSTKSSVYESFEGNPFGYIVDRGLFERRMDAAAKIIEASKNQLRKDIGEMLVAAKPQP